MDDEGVTHVYMPDDFDDVAVKLEGEATIAGIRAAREFKKYLDETDENLFDQLIRQEIVGIIPDKYYGLLTIIAVDDQTTSVNIRDSAALALQIRDKVIEWQGYHLPQYAYEMLDMIDHGMSYAEIANHANERLEHYLYSVLYERKQTRPERERVINDWFSILPPGADMIELMVVRPLMEEARETLLALRFSRPTIEGLLNEWLGYMERGEKFFARDIPIDRDKVISVIKYWRNRPGPSVAETGQV